MHYFKKQQLLNTNLQAAWVFFSDPKNLARITPPELDFIISSKSDTEKVYEGMIIEYKVKPLLGIPVKWKTVLTNINEPYSFKDIQINGPYKQWEHTHIFKEIDNKVLMIDEIKYRLSLGRIGILLNSIIIENKIKAIFDYRENILNKIFSDEFDFA